MTFALYELAYRKGIQDKVRKEVIEVTNRHNGEITYEAIAEMTYLDQVVNGLQVLMTRWVPFTYVFSL